MSAPGREWTGFEIAIIGMAARLPGAEDVDALWRLLRDGVEGIRRLDPQALIAAGRDPAEVLAPQFVPAHGVLEGFDTFDAGFFDMRVAEAEGLDPQQRVFLECAWHALENAAIDPARAAGLIGVFAGASANTYLQYQLQRNPAALARIGAFQAGYSNQADHLATRVAYKLNLRGPAVAVQSACSTSLVAIHLACQQLLAGGCDLALAGGVSLSLPRDWGYLHQEGMILSPDGHCRAFDARAAGTLKGDGVGLVVLKRLADALADGDRIDAVLLASAINNDGAAKVGYTAPGAQGQAEVIAAVQQLAGVGAHSIGLVEAHGTGTPLGDPIELAALTQVFAADGAARGACALGSIKSQIGHLDAAAGVAGLIKCVLALRQACLPGSLHFERPNPQLKLEQSPFFVPPSSRAWPAGAGPRRAAVSSFGIGGTNAHAWLEQAPPLAAVQNAPASGPQLLRLSARDPQALAQACARLADHLANPLVDPLQALAPLNLADVAHTLHHGRQAFALRHSVVARDVTQAVAALRQPFAPPRPIAERAPRLVFLFPGQGAQHPGMGRGLYRDCAVFRASVDSCCDTLAPGLGLDLRELLLADPSDALAAQRLQQTALTQPALFVVELALARSLMALGLKPDAMVGHSLGEITAACVAGVFGTDDALRLVLQRGQLMQAQAAGAMLAVPMAWAELVPLLHGSGVDLAAENAPQQCVLSGPLAAVQALATRLAAQGIQGVRLKTSHAFHSAMMEPARAPLQACVAGLARQAPALRIASTVSGTWLDAAQACDPQHWGRNLRQPVRFGPALQCVLAQGPALLLELGPGSTLTALARRQPAAAASIGICALAAPAQGASEPGDDASAMLALLGQAWCAGLPLAGHELQTDAPRRRSVALPGYPFQRRRYWVQPVPTVPPGVAPALPAPLGPASPAPAGAERAAADAAGQRLYLPAWRRSAAPGPWVGTESTQNQSWVLVGRGEDAAPFAQALRQRGAQVRVAEVKQAGDWAAQGQALAGGVAVQQLLVLWPTATSGADGAAASATAAGSHAQALPGLFQALAAQPLHPAPSISLVGANLFAVLGDERLDSAAALPQGWLQVLSAEWPGLRVRVLDQPARDASGVAAVLHEAQSAALPPRVAWRGAHRWVQHLLPVPLPAAPAPGLPARLRARAVVLITGGLGAMGLALAEHLARSVQARLVLCSRRVLPARQEWPRRIAQGAAGDPTRGLLQRLQALEAAGAELLLGSVDVCDAAAMAALCTRARERFGAIHGLIHAAGLAGGGVIALQREADVNAVLAPKVRGTQVLLAELAGDRLDFAVLCSSLSSFVPLAGRADYTGANLYLDALAQARAAGPTHLVSINWDNWLDAGMAHAAAREPMVGLSVDEGVAAFNLALAEDEPQWLVARRDLLAGPADHVSVAPVTQALPVAAVAGAGSATATGAAPALALGAGSAVAGPPAAMSPAEGVIAELWRDLLGQPVNHAQADFFDLGGDSVVSIQFIARARHAGLVLNARQVFELRTVAALARAATAAAAPRAPAAATSARSAGTRLPLSPVQHWFFDLALPQPGHWNLGLTLGLPPHAQPADVQRCLAQVLARHDALSLRFEQGAPGVQVYRSAAAGFAFELIELTEPLATARAMLERRAQAPFDLAGGPLLRAVQARSPDGAGLLAIGAHHLVTDLIGLRALAEELNDAWAQADAPPACAGTGWCEWAERLYQHAQSQPVRAALAWWVQQGSLGVPTLPRDRPEGSARQAQMLSQTLHLHATRATALAAASPGLAAAMLGALAQALTQWSGQPQAWIDVEGHGRESFADDLDVSRTLGWFTATYPLRLARQTNAAGAGQQAAQALAALPQRGASFGWLRHLHADPAVRAELARLPQPEVVFLYQGRLPGAAARPAALPLLALGAEHGHADDEPPTHVLQINAWLDTQGLHLACRYSPALHAAASIAGLLKTMDLALDEIAASRQPAPPRFGAAAGRRAALSMAQERMWFLQRLQPETTLFNKQALLQLDGELDIAALQAALGDLTRRHETLRTRFVEVDGQPWQQIDDAAPFELPQQGLGADGLAQAERQARERAQQGFDLAARAPFEARLFCFGPTRHALVFSLHHIVADAWSFQVLQADLAALYNARRAGRPAALAPLPLPFAEQAQRQRQRLDGTALQALLGYWQGQLPGLLPLELPTDRLRPAVQRFEGARVPLRWSADLTARFRRLTRRHGASLFMGLLALYKLLLHRYTGVTDLVVGIPAADRPEVDTEGLIGPLVNNLVLRTDWSGQPDFTSVLARVREVAIAANEHRDLPFEQLVQALRPQRDRSRAPLCQVMFAFMNVPTDTPAWDGLQVAARELPAGGSEFELSLYAYDPGNAADAALTGWFEFASALFDAPRIERLAGHFERLAQAVCAEPACPVGRLPMLSAAEQDQVLRGFNATARAHPPYRGLHRLIEAQVQRTPQALAVRADDAWLSYAQLDAQANQLARCLRREGVVADARVVLCTHRDSWMMVALLAILKAGGAYVPVDPAYPAERIADMVQDSQAVLMLTHSRWRARLPTGRALCLDSDRAAWADEDSGVLDDASGPQHLAYVIYTSGSTGQPKGVQIEHAAALNLVQATAREPGVAPGETLLALSTISFDIHLFELFAPLAVGATVQLVSAEVAADGCRLRALLDGGGLHIVQATPATWRLLIDAGWAGTPGLKIMSTGEALPLDLAQALLARGAQLWNLYGPTEVTVWGSFERVVDGAGPITVGRPFDNLRSYVLDRHDQPLPIGVPGELIVAGAGVARGYLNRPELSAERFLDDPFVPGQRAYRTGDLARWRSDGRIEVLGRLDHQVKLRGYRIELGEIEHVMAGHAALAQCVALVREDRPGDQRLMLYAVAAAAGLAQPSLAELRRHAAQRLPDFMLPQGLMWLAHLPQTPNGKIDRQALPAPPGGPAAQPERAAEPATLSPGERLVADAFSAALGGTLVTRLDNFFDLGGHSLLVLRVVESLRRRAGIELHPGELYQQTVGQIAQQHAPALARVAAPASPAAAAAGVETLRAGYFNPGRLYGVWHEPAAPQPRAAVLLCAPLGHEGIRCHRALRQLAAQLAARGARVLRFDWSGSGDSAGAADQLRLAQCRIDLAAALDELRRHSAAAPLCLLGLRLGATLALEVAARQGDIARLALWHPVLDGPALLAQWRAEQRDFCRAMGWAGPIRDDEVMGAPLPAQLALEIAAIDGRAPRLAAGLPVLLAHGAAEQTAAQRLAVALQAQGAWPECRILEHAPMWRQEPLQALVPQPALQALVAWLLA